jgi:hypothetical protein
LRKALPFFWLLPQIPWSASASNAPLGTFVPFSSLQSVLPVSLLSQWLLVLSHLTLCLQPQCSGAVSTKLHAIKWPGRDLLTAICSAHIPPFVLPSIFQKIRKQDNKHTVISEKKSLPNPFFKETSHQIVLPLNSPSTMLDVQRIEAIY